MHRETDWIALWAELAQLQRLRRAKRAPRDPWAGRAADFRARVKRRWRQPDSTRRTVCSWLGPGRSILDIGAGTGDWAALFAGTGAQVTALDPSDAMIGAMEKNFREQGLDIPILRGRWPELEVQPHDYLFCSHALYDCPDLRAFVERMQQKARHTCAVVLRVPPQDSIMAQAARMVLGQPHDSPNFAVFYNALLQLGIYAHVQMDDAGPWGRWSHGSLEEALAEVKSRLGLEGPDERDEALLALLEERLEPWEGRLRWPPTVRSALVWWEV